MLVQRLQPLRGGEVLFGGKNVFLVWFVVIYGDFCWCLVCFWLVVFGWERRVEEVEMIKKGGGGGEEEDSSQEGGGTWSSSSRCGM